MLDSDLKQQVQSLFEGLHSAYILRISTDAGNPQSEELVELLQDVASCSDNITVVEEIGNNLQFTIEKDGVPSSIIFKAIPNGHEFSTLLLAILNLDGKGKNLPDETIIGKIKQLKGKHVVKSYIALHCINCPDVVQAINVMSIYNPNIRHEIIDGAMYEDEVKALNIQAVPTVYADSDTLHIGRATFSELLAKMEDHCGLDTDVKIEGLDKVKEYDVVVAGGGPSGATAAIYIARKGFKVAVVADRIGGQVLDTTAIENFTSVPVIQGKELGADLRTHMSKYPIDIFDQREIEFVSQEDGKNIISTSLGEKFSARALIIATGASWRKLNVPNEEKYIGKGVAFCTHCDGPFYKDKKVVVIGGGNSGLEAAIDLAGIASHVTVLEFAPKLNGDQVLQDKLSTFSNVTIHTNAMTTEVIGNGKEVVGIKYQNRETNEEIELETDGIFVQIGLSANSAPFKSLVEVNRAGEIEIDVYGRTKTKGIYAAGDVTIVPFKQIIIAMGEGAKAALAVFEDSIKGVI